MRRREGNSLKLNYPKMISERKRFNDRRLNMGCRFKWRKFCPLHQRHLHHLHHHHLHISHHHLQDLLLHQLQDIGHMRECMEVVRCTGSCFIYRYMFLCFLGLWYLNIFEQIFWCANMSKYRKVKRRKDVVVKPLYFWGL